MAYYDKLVEKWATLVGTTDEKITAINALVVGGPNVDVAVSSVVGRLMLSGAYLPLAAFSQSAPTGIPVHDTALGAAKMLMALLTTPNAPTFAMSDPTSYAAIKMMMDAILAQETATPNSTGFTQAVHDALLALAVSQVPWWRANGYPAAIGGQDLVDAGLQDPVPVTPLPLPGA